MKSERRRGAKTEPLSNVDELAGELPGLAVESAGAADDPGVAAVNRAFMILECFRDDEAILSLAVISKKTGMYKSTILRLLQSLEAYGYIVRLPSGAYAVGVAPIRLADLARKSMHPAEKIMPTLRDLSQTTGTSASFYVRSGRNLRQCAYRVDSPRSIRDNIRVGELLALDRGAGGKVLLDFDGMGSASAVRAQAPLLRVTRGERDSETAAMASPVFGPNWHLEGALSLSGPIQHFDEDAVRSMTVPLLKAARSLTLSFFGDGSVFEA